MRGERAAIILLVLVWLVEVSATSHAQVRAQRHANVAEQYLFLAANAERQARGLALLRWDAALQQAAFEHAYAMASRYSISHQYAGEAELQERAGAAGSRFSVVAENVAEAPSAELIHRGWMRSEHHRENLLDPRLDRIAISVLERDGQLYAVEDFDRSVAALSFAEQEDAVADLLQSSAGLRVGTGSEQARQTCELDTGFAGLRKPWFVMRFTASELSALPVELLTRLHSGRYREAQVGACPLRGSGGFSGYAIAVLLFP